MDNKISTDTKAELVRVLGIQYRKSSKTEKTRILDQFIAVSGYHRKHAIRLLKIAAIDFVGDAFGHLKEIAADTGVQVLLKIANVGHDAGVVDTKDKDAFIAAAMTRQWDRERSVRTLA